MFPHIVLHRTTKVPVYKVFVVNGWWIEKWYQRYSYTSIPPLPCQWKMAERRILRRKGWTQWQDIEQREGCVSRWKRSSCRSYRRDRYTGCRPHLEHEGLRNVHFDRLSAHQFLLIWKGKLFCHARLVLMLSLSYSTITITLKTFFRSYSRWHWTPFNLFVWIIFKYTKWWINMM